MTAEGVMVVPGIPEHEDLLHHLPVGVVVQDPELRILYGNHAAGRLLGAPPAELQDRSSLDPEWAAITPDGDPLPGDRHPAARVMDTGQAVRDMVMGVRTLDGSGRRWLLVSSEPRRDDRGAITGVITVFTDISGEHLAARQRQADLESLVQRRTRDLSETVEELRSEMAEREATERRLAEREALFASVVAAAAEGIVFHDAEGRIQLSNPAAHRVLGLSAAQLRGRFPLDPGWRLVDGEGEPLDPAHVPSEIARTTGRPVDGTVLGVQPEDGPGRWLAVSARPVGRRPVPPCPVVATFMDVTRLRDTQRRLAANEARLARILAAVPGLVYEARVDAGGAPRLTFVDGQLVAAMELSTEDVQATALRIEEALALDDRRRLGRRLRGAAGAPEAFVEELAFRMPGQPVRWLAIHGRPDVSEGAIRWTGFALDITARRALAEGLARSQRMETLSQLAAGVAHNFNNMLSAVIPNLELALEHVDEVAAAPLRDAREAAEGAAQLVRQLLTSARGEPDEALVVVDLRHSLQASAALCRSTFDPAMHLDIRLPTVPVSVRASDSRLQNIVLNLLINARDALEGRPDPRITVRLEAEDGLARLTIADNGAGMPAEDRARLGEPFFTTKGPRRGTGLGLPSVFALMEELGGQVHIDSAVDEGTTFVLTLPRVDHAPQEVRPPPRRAGDLSRLRVLVVDDEPLVRSALCRLLRGRGIEVDEAGDGAEGRARADGSHDVVLLDVAMPGVDGPQLLGELKARFPETPVAMLTGHVDDLPALEGADRVFHKPLRAEELLGWLRDLRGGLGGD